MAAILPPSKSVPFRLPPRAIRVIEDGHIVSLERRQLGQHTCPIGTMPKFSRNGKSLVSRWVTRTAAKYSQGITRRGAFVAVYERGAAHLAERIVRL
jgi:hypothetical protein